MCHAKVHCNFALTLSISPSHSTSFLSYSNSLIFQLKNILSLCWVTIRFILYCVPKRHVLSWVLQRSKLSESMPEYILLLSPSFWCKLFSNLRMDLALIGSSESVLVYLVDQSGDQESRIMIPMWLTCGLQRRRVDSKCHVALHCCLRVCWSTPRDFSGGI